MAATLFWIRAARPKTLPAAAVPVVVGGALAFAGDAFEWLPWAVCLAFALLIQVGTNYANDYYDFVKGADDDKRIGPARAVASGWIAPEQMARGMWLVFGLAFILGCALIPFGGWWLLAVGAISILCGIAYTGGPYPLGYNGLGDIFVFIFFGWVATGFTLYVQAGTFHLSLPESSGAAWTWLAGVLPGALATNLLVVNNVRDEPLDRVAGKRTLAVRFGRRFGYWQFGLLNALAIGVAIAFAVVGGLWGCWLVLLALPLAIIASRRLVTATDRATYDSALGLTALLLIVAGGLFAIGLML